MPKASNNQPKPNQDQPADPPAKQPAAADGVAPAPTEVTSTPESDLPNPSLEDEALPQPPNLKKSRKGLVIALVIVLLLAAAAAAWYFLLRNQPAPAPEPAPQTSAEQQSDVGDDVPEAENTETFTSDPYRITFKYPKTWTVNEEQDNSLLIQSEDFTYQSADQGESKRGNFRVYIRKGATTADSEIIAKGIAVEPSQSLTYTSPTPGQRTETNLTNFGLDSASNFAFLLITSNFNLKAGDVLGPNFGQEVDTFIIGGGYSESSLKPGLATNSVPLEGFNETNAYKQALAIIQSLEIK